MLDEYVDDVFDEDALFLERNSRTFRSRIARIDVNAETLADLLYAHRGRGGVRDVFYPKYETRDHYRARLRRPTPAFPTLPGYGGLLSITFTSQRVSAAFFDALDCCKGPSLGTAFTLACPYTILAHYTELEWAAKLGVPDNLVRVSVGTEDPALIRLWFERALDEAARVADGAPNGRGA